MTAQNPTPDDLRISAKMLHDDGYRTVVILIEAAALRLEEAERVIAPISTDLLTEQLIGTKAEIIKELGKRVYDKLPDFRAAAKWMEQK